MASVFDYYVYADESGEHDSPQYALIAGYIARPRPWLRFEKRWNRVLKQYDVRDFHAKDFFAFAGRRRGKYRRSTDGAEARYGDWSDDKYFSFRDSLVKLIGQRTIRPLHVAVDMGAWNELSYGQRRFLTGGAIDRVRGRFMGTGAPSRPYFFLFLIFLETTLRKVGMNQRLLFVFDEHETHRGLALDLYNEIYQNNVFPKLGSRGELKYLSRHEAPGLQAADLLANTWHCYVTKREKMGKVREDVMNVLAAQENILAVYGREEIQEALAGLPQYAVEIMNADVKPQQERK